MVTKFTSAKYNGSRKKTEHRRRITEEALKCPEDISSVDAQKVWWTYGLEQQTCAKHTVPNPKSSNCRDNPYCIARLGLEKFEKLLKKVEEYKKQKMEDAKRRDTCSQPCGLSNYGNYCYVNSFLQVWFNDPVFRQIIFDWRPSPLYKRPVPPTMDVESVMDCLQELFFTLQTSPYEHTSGDRFCKSLRLGNEQQDAQEFTLMFFDALDRNLAKHPNGPAISQRIQQRFCGETTTSLNCKCGHKSVTTTRFTSLTLSIEGHKTLSSVLSAYVAPEELSDFRCSACDKKGGVTRSSFVNRLPPVLLISLNRYVFDSTGRNKKNKNAVQYTWEMDIARSLRCPSPAAKYELSAVMVHEGDSVHCGHYFDIVKHPHHDKWYKYDDEKVKEVKAPGVEEEKADASMAKGANDLKFSYGLVYRRMEKVGEMKLPPQHMTAKWSSDIEDRFSSLTGTGIECSDMCIEEVQKRFDTLSLLFADLEVKSERAVQKKGREMVFLPTKLLSELIGKEYDRAVDVQKALADISDESKNEETNITEEEAEGTPSTVEDGSSLRRTRTRRKVKSLFDRRIGTNDVAHSLAVHHVQLCKHSKLPIEAVLEGELKAVNKSAAEKLLNHYSLAVTVCLPNGEKPTEGRLKNGSELCDECVVEMFHDAHMRKRLEDDATFATKTSKESKTRCSVMAFINRGIDPPADRLYVSKSALQSFKKEAIRQLNKIKYDESQSNSTLAFGPYHLRYDRSVMMNGNGNGNGWKRKKTEGEEEEEECSASKQQRVKDGSVECLTACEDEIICLDDEKMSEDVKGEKEEGVEGGKDARGRSRSDSRSGEERPSSSNGDDDDDSTAPSQFNHQLACEHDGINVHEFRMAVTPVEWKRLSRYFPDPFVVPVTRPLCSKCQHNEQAVMQNKSESVQQLKELRTSMMEIMKNAERRTTSAIGSGEFSRGLCSKFAAAASAVVNRSSSSTRVPELPPLCQQCLRCRRHELPCYSTGFIGEEHPRVLPLTEEEWEKVLSVWPSHAADDSTPVALLSNGDIDHLCVPCNQDILLAEASKKFTYENGTIFVKMQNDEPSSGSGGEKGQGTSGGTDKAHMNTLNTRMNGNGVGKTSTRRIPKGMYKLKLSSTATVKQLKVQLYAKVQQSPCDQLIYSGGALLEDDCTLSQARVQDNNIDNPLILVVQTVNDSSQCSSTEPRTLERGFTDTALAH